MKKEMLEKIVRQYPESALAEAWGLEQKGLKEEAKRRYAYVAYEVSDGSRIPSEFILPFARSFDRWQLYDLAAECFKRAGLKDEAKAVFAKAGREQLLEVHFRPEDFPVRWKKGIEYLQKGLSREGVVEKAKELLKDMEYENQYREAFERQHDLPDGQWLEWIGQVERFIKQP